MRHIYYFMAIFPILWELYTLQNILKVHNFSKKFKKDAKDKKFDEWTDSQKALSIFMIGYLVWAFIGLFSSQWILFLFIFVISFIPKVNITIRWIDSFISVLVFLFILLNTYHFHIDIIKLLNL